MTKSAFCGMHRDDAGSFEVFHHPKHYNLHDDGRPQQDKFSYPAGWYWWSCSPGCIPDGEAAGPFKSSREAYQDARRSGDIDECVKEIERRLPS